MSKFIYNIHYRPRFKIGKPDSLSSRSEEEKSGMDTPFFKEGQVLDLGNNNVLEEKDVKDVEVKEIDMAIWEKENRIRVVLQKYRLEVLWLHNNR